MKICFSFIVLVVRVRTGLGVGVIVVVIVVVHPAQNVAFLSASEAKLLHHIRQLLALLVYHTPRDFVRADDY